MFKKHRTLFLLILFYFLARLFNLTIIPIFNDEAIYLDWGWRSLHTPDSLYYSLFDGKQPFLMWIFGFAQQFFDNPVLAGRLVSVFAGFITLLGIFHIGRKYYNERIAFFASLTYILTPIFSFFDRQALMESSMSMTMVWSCYTFLSLLEKHSVKMMVALGTLFGLGFFIKSTTAIFAISIVLLTVMMLMFSSMRKHIKNRSFILDMTSSFIIGCMLLIPLFFQQQFWGTLSMNNRFSFSISELLGFPLLHWFRNTKSILEISFWHLTPLIFLSSVYGVALHYKEKLWYRKIILLYFLSSLFLYAILSKSPSPRYTVSFLPLLTIFSAYVFYSYTQDKNLIGRILVFLAGTSVAIITLIQIFSPLSYFSFMDRVTTFSGKSEYVTSWTSGYGVMETVNFLKDKKKPLIVGVRVDSGNPENAIISYFHNHNEIKPGYFDRSLINTDLAQIDCITFPSEFYFISRGPQLAGLEKYLVEVTRFNKPEGEEFVGIYTVKTPCTGKSLKMNDIL